MHNVNKQRNQTEHSCPVEACILCSKTKALEMKPTEGLIFPQMTFVVLYYWLSNIYFSSITRKQNLAVQFSGLPMVCSRFDEQNTWASFLCATFFRQTYFPSSLVFSLSLSVINIHIG